MLFSSRVTSTYHGASPQVRMHLSQWPPFSEVLSDLWSFATPYSSGACKEAFFVKSLPTIPNNAVLMLLFGRAGPGAEGRDGRGGSGGEADRAGAECVGGGQGQARLAERQLRAAPASQHGQHDAAGAGARFPSIRPSAQLGKPRWLWQAQTLTRGQDNSF